MIDESDDDTNGYSAPAEDNGAVRRPRLAISRNQIALLLEKRYLFLKLLLF